jgi:hypothetical protein
MLIRNSDFGPAGLGYLQVDNRAGAELPPGTAVHFEADTYTCSHCERVVVLNPARKRERYKCASCAHHICDDCAARAVTGERCLPYKTMVEQVREQAARQAQSPSILLP